MSERLLRPLSALALAFALAGPLAAFEVDSIQLNPAAPTSDDLVVVTVTGLSETPCFFFAGVQQYEQNIDFVFSGCQILPPFGDTPVTESAEIGPLPPGTYRVRVISDAPVIEELVFNVLPATGPCTPGAAALCLNRRRFRVEAEWSAHGERGAGQAIPLSGEAGAFSFFQPDNVEVVVKVIEGCALNGRFWVFATGLTNVRTVLTVTDTVTGASRTYRNPAGTPFAPVQDISAFPCS
jgi:hypothetical protein